MNTQSNLGLIPGILGALGMVMLVILGDPAELGSWVPLLASLVGVLTGVGITLGIALLVVRRRGS